MSDEVDLFKEAESSLRRLGSNLWFGGLSEAWREFLILNTVDFFENYEVTMIQAAEEVIKLYRRVVSLDPAILRKDPSEVTFNFDR